MPDKIDVGGSKKVKTLLTKSRNKFISEQGYAPSDKELLSYIRKKEITTARGRERKAKLAEKALESRLQYRKQIEARYVREEALKAKRLQLQRVKAGVGVRVSAYEPKTRLEREKTKRELRLLSRKERREAGEARERRLQVAKGVYGVGKTAYRAGRATYRVGRRAGEEVKELARGIRVKAAIVKKPTIIVGREKAIEKTKKGPVIHRGLEVRTKPSLGLKVEPKKKTIISLFLKEKPPELPSKLKVIAWTGEKKPTLGEIEIPSPIKEKVKKPVGVSVLGAITKKREEK